MNTPMGAVMKVKKPRIESTSAAVAELDSG